MNNTSKGLPATCYHQAKHKTTLNQRIANREKGINRWANRQLGLGTSKRVLRNLARQKPESPEAETKN